MAATSSMAHELVSLFSHSNYKEYCQYLTERDAVSLEHFGNTMLGKSFWIDVRRCFNQSGLNTSHVLEIFGQFSDQNPEDLRERVINIVKEDTKHWDHLGTVVLQMKLMSLEHWLEMMSKPDCMCDELMLFVLNRIHCRHTVVYTRNRSWSTVHSTTPLSEDELHRECHVHLVYLGNYIFGELRHLPMLPFPASNLPAMPIISHQKKPKKLRESRLPLDKSGVIMEGTPDASQPVRHVFSPEICLDSDSSEPVNAPTTTCDGNMDSLSTALDRLDPNIGLDSHSSDYAEVSMPRPDDLRSGNVTPQKLTCNGNTDSLPTDLDSLDPNVGLDSHSSSHADVPVPRPSDLRSGNVNPLQKLVREYFSKNAPTVDCDILIEKYREKMSDDLKSQNKETVSCPADTGTTATSESAQKAPPEELKQVSYQELNLQVLCTNFLKDNFPKIDVDIKNIQSIITEHKKKIARQCETYLQSLGLKIKPVVIVSKLKPDSLNVEKKTHWSQIDPYSDLEETRSNPQNDNPDGVTHSGVYFDVIGGHTLRKRKRSYQCNRLRRENSANKFYRGMCSEKLNKKKKPTKKLSVKPSRSPSTIRKNAQEIINTNKENRLNGVEVNRRLTRSYPLFQPIKSPLASDNENVLDTDTDETEIESKTVNEKTDNKVDTTTNTVNNDLEKTDEKPLKGKLKTETFGIKRDYTPKRIRNYYCPKCKKCFHSCSALNDHFRTTHTSMRCKVCKMEFNTPNALTRHSYVHKVCKFECDVCEKRFPFEKDRDSHMISHRKLRTQCCNHPNCGRKFFRKGDLVKHVLTHSKKVWSCELCDYKNNDRRNLKAHMRVHSNLRPYICSNCAKLFKYHAQLSRHLPCKSGARSSSPEF